MTPHFEEFEDCRPVIDDLSQNTLATIPTFFGRLNYVASLRDPTTGHYQHYGLERLYGEGPVQRGLVLCQEELFCRILEMPLEEQERDLRGFLAGLDEPLTGVAANWRQLQPYRLWLPLEALDCLRLLFLSNIEILLELLAPSSELTLQTA